MITTSYKAFKILELLRLRCGLTARETAEHLMRIDESNYSRLCANLEAGTGALSAEYDRKVQIALIALTELVSDGTLPATVSDKELALRDVDAVVDLRVRSVVTAPGISAADLNRSLPALVDSAYLINDRL